MRQKVRPAGNYISVAGKTSAEIIEIGKELHQLSNLALGWVTHTIQNVRMVLLQETTREELDRCLLIQDDGWTVFVYDQKIVGVASPRMLTERH